MASIGRVRSAVTVGLRQSSLRGPVPHVPRPPVDRRRVAPVVRALMHHVAPFGSASKIDVCPARCA